MEQIPDDYPSHVNEVLDSNFKFKRGVIAAARRYAKSKPWTGTKAKRVRSLKRLYREICKLYGVEMPLLNTRGLGAGDSSSSAYVPAYTIIFLSGRFSVVTSLHELAHHLGMGEREACRWSINLFKRVWPKQFSRCIADGHVLRRQSPNKPSGDDPQA